MAIRNSYELQRHHIEQTYVYLSQQTNLPFIDLFIQLNSHKMQTLFVLLSLWLNCLFLPALDGWRLTLWKSLGKVFISVFFPLLTVFFCLCISANAWREKKDFPQCCLLSLFIIIWAKRHITSLFCLILPLSFLHFSFPPLLLLSNLLFQSGQSDLSQWSSN